MSKTVLFQVIQFSISHHHHVMLPAWISLTLSRHFSQSFIASDRSSGLHPVSLQSCSMYVQAGHPAFARSYVGVHRSTSLMSSSLLLQQCPACLVCLTWIVFVMGGSWPYSWCLVGCCLQDLFNIAHSILSGAPNLGQSGHGNDGNEEVLCIPQSSSITGASTSDCFVSYPEHPLGVWYPSAEIQSVYSTDPPPADWARKDNR